MYTYLNSKTLAILFSFGIINYFMDVWSEIDGTHKPVQQTLSAYCPGMYTILMYVAKKCHYNCDVRAITYKSALRIDAPMLYFHSPISLYI